MLDLGTWKVSSCAGSAQGESAGGYKGAPGVKGHTLHRLRGLFIAPCGERSAQRRGRSPARVKRSATPK
jgi:hypothetical protein